MKDFYKFQKDMDSVFKEMDNVFKRMEKMMETAEAQMEEKSSPWQKWFAWRPVEIKGKQRWMCNVYRRKTNTYVNYDNWAEYEYGDIFDVLKEAGDKQSFTADEVQQGPV